jgi:hypothetical protein
MSHPTNWKSLSNLVLKAVAVAMGVAVVVLQTMHAAPPETAITLLGLGLFTLALSSLPQPQ